MNGEISFLGEVCPTFKFKKWQTDLFSEEFIINRQFTSSWMKILTAEHAKCAEIFLFFSVNSVFSVAIFKGVKY